MPYVCGTTGCARFEMDMDESNFGWRCRECGARIVRYSGGRRRKCGPYGKTKKPWGVK